MSKIWKFLLVLLSCWSLSDCRCQHTCINNGTCNMRELNSICYYVFNQYKMTWNASRAFCASQGLAMVVFGKEMIPSGHNLKGLFKDANAYAWLGGRAKDLNCWTFVNGVPLNETYSDEPSPFQGGQELHLCASVDSNVVVDKGDCLNIRNFICRFDDWYKTPSFYTSETPVSWFEARSRCLDLGGDLFYLRKGEAINYLKTKLQPYKETKLFIGLTLRMWEWEDNRQILYYNWQFPKPDKVNEKCLTLHPSTGLWNNADCQTSMTPLCQRAASSIPTYTEQPIFQNTIDTMVAPRAESSNAAPGVLSFFFVISLISAVGIALYHLRFRNNLKKHKQGRYPDSIEPEHELLNSKTKESGEEIDSSKDDTKMDMGEEEISDDESTTSSEHKTTAEKKPGIISKKFHGAWVSDVYFQDQTSRCRISLTLPQLEVTLENNRGIPKNAKLLNKDVFKPGYIQLEIEVEAVPGKSKTLKYMYYTKLPEKIIPKKSKVKYAPGRIILDMKKAEDVPWEQHEQRQNLI